MSALDIPPALLVPSKLDGRTEGGAFSYIARSPVLAQILARADLAQPQQLGMGELG